MRQQYSHRLICFLLGVVLLLLPAPALRAQAIEWQMATEYPSTSMPGEGLRFFAEAVARESGGRIIFKPSFDSALGIKSADVNGSYRNIWMNKYENESHRRREAVMRFLIRMAVATAVSGFITAVVSPAPVHADSINSCIDRCFNTFHPPSDCPTCTGERDRCVEQCSKTAYSYGAIAFGAKSKAWGTSYQWRTRAEAESKALTSCSEHGKDCKVIVWFEHSCGAVATGEVDNIFWGLGNGEGAARKNALDKCAQGGGRNCKVQVSKCSR